MRRRRPAPRRRPVPPRGRLLIFDLDGTLLDTRRDLTAAVNAMRAGYGRGPLSVAAVTGYIGDGLSQLVRRSLRGARIDFDEATRRCAHFYRRHLFDETRPYPGVRAVLRRLKKAGYLLAVVSNKPATSCRRLLRHFGLAALFERVLGGDSTLRRKPHPEPLRAVMRSLGVRPAQTWMIGDHRTDLESAKRAGARSIWMSRGMGRRGSFRPDRVFRRFSELTAFFAPP